MKVIIIGTAQEVRTGLGTHLLMRGHEVHAFDSGEAALLHVESYGADVVVLDHTLPDMAPTTVAMHLRQWTPDTKIPVLIVTDHNKIVH